MDAQINPKHIKALIAWLLVCCASVFVMIIVGAITRLTESGLSITEWNVVTGILPPLNDAGWQSEFDLYKKTPEFLLKNSWMELDDFKTIYFWEWAHRLLGRLFGALYALPLLFFCVKKWIPPHLKLRLIGIFILGGAQGFMGWYMVQSGLVDQPAVSHYRLAAHLGLAFAIYAAILWTALDLNSMVTPKTSKPDNLLYKQGLITTIPLILTIFWGAYTAGLDAGLVYNDSFPKMGNTWIPSEVWFSQPYWKNLFENHAGVQFMHRWLAMFTALMIVGYALHAGYKKRIELCFPLLGAMVLLQIGLGVATLYTLVFLPIAVIHQAGAVVLVTLMIMSLHTVRARTAPKHAG
jgi:cytochrome c oxidase assembly protein subunit 15